MGAVERDEFLRAAWRVTVVGPLEPQRLVFVDKMGTNTPALSARLTTLLAAVASASTRRLADWETPVYASDAEMDDALWEDLG